MNRERLEHLKEILAKVPEDEFDMDHWTPAEAERYDCGTACCALGWAAQDPQFNDEGLSIVGCWIEYNDAHDMKAGMWFFELNYEKASHIFLPSRYVNTSVTPQDVISHIDDVLEGKITLEP